ncbi:MAG: YezD family protein [Verrucomicrobiales bacterium]|nr:YezD family protein [Verrucomicrobiales bacterium]
MSACTLHQPGPGSEPPCGTSWIEIVQRYVSSLRFGVVEIVVHEGRVTQIERTERFRLDNRTSPPASAAVTICRVIRVTRRRLF